MINPDAGKKSWAFEFISLAKLTQAREAH